MRQERMQAVDVSELLASTDVFNGLDTSSLARVASLRETLEFERGQTLFKQGQPADRLYVLVSGGVGVRTYVEDCGDVLVQSVRDAGDVFGWSALVEPFEYSYTAHAHEAGSAVVIPGAPLLDLLGERPELGLAVFKNLAKGLAVTLHQTRSSLVTIASRGQISQG